MPNAEIKKVEGMSDSLISDALPGKPTIIGLHRTKKNKMRYSRVILNSHFLLNLFYFVNMMIILYISQI